MKKKLWAGLVAAALSISVSAMTVLAGGPHCPNRSGRHNADGIRAYYTDENCDGICDYFGSGAYGGGHCGGHGGCRR